MYNMDRLFEAVALRGHVCVGLDTAADYIPPALLRRAASDAEAAAEFNRAIIDATADIAACYKVQIACYEAMGLAGLRAYAETLAFIRRRGSLVIADIKRGDIADTAAQYAKAHFGGEFEADFVTLSPYMGMDTLEPWLAYAASRGKGAFVLMRTSNKGMRDFEYLELAGPVDSVCGPGAGPETAGSKTDGGVHPAASPRRLYDAVGEKLSALARSHRGGSGYGAFGAVIGCTEREEAAAIRRTYGDLFFLIPGYGVQGGTADDAALLLRDGNGGVINASRSILGAWKKAPGVPSGAENQAFAAAAAREAVITMRDAIQAAGRTSQAVL
ncbi:MAG: orotidine-5'-phosphate decarboxylase [Treponema sp.]|jgi:orotidine-5'-phosphate decarboxylase|nr:orotidine-5'-phosphate decarboxylase [Treponema sp.]